MDHLSLQCTFATSVWTGASQQLGFAIHAPSPQSVLSRWWPDAVANLSKADAKVANSFVMLTIRSLWLERNARVFENSPSPASRVIDVVLAEWALWIRCRRRSGPSGGVGLPPPPPPVRVWRTDTELLQTLSLNLNTKTHRSHVGSLKKT
jgi:hypothetical protein